MSNKYATDVEKIVGLLKGFNCKLVDWDLYDDTGELKFDSDFWDSRKLLKYATQKERLLNEPGWKLKGLVISYTGKRERISHGGDDDDHRPKKRPRFSRESSTYPSSCSASRDIEMQVNRSSP